MLYDPHRGPLAIPAAPRHATQLRVISTRQGLVGSVGVFGAVLGPSAAFALFSFAALFNVPSLGWWGGWQPHALALVLCAGWLAVVLRDMPWGALVAAILALVGATLAQVATGSVGDLVTTAGWAVAGTCLSLVVASDRYISPQMLGLAPRWATNRHGRRQACAVAGAAFAGMCASGFLGGLLSLMSWLPRGQVPDDVTSHAVGLIVHIVATSVVEELVVVALLVALLEAANRPIWQIYAIGMAMRVSYHLYYGPSAVMVVVFEAINLWLYRHTRRLTPLIVAHVLYDAFAGFGGFIAAHVTSAIGALTLIELTFVLIVRVYRKSCDIAAH